jgi:hypothetical protein
MLARRRLLAGFAGLSGLSLAGCGRHAPQPSFAYAPPGGGSWSSNPKGLDAVIDISHNVRVSDFNAVRKHDILAVIHKATEGGDWVDPSYAERRAQAEQAGLLWGAYHFGTRQYPGARQAQAFLAVARPTPRTLIALDFELNDPNPNNTMTLPQAEEFVRVVQQQTGRLPMVYTHARWANGEHGRQAAAPACRSRSHQLDPGTLRPLACRPSRGAASTLRLGGPRLEALAICRRRERQQMPPTAPSRAPSPASPTATATCSPATARPSIATGASAERGPRQSIRSPVRHRRITTELPVDCRQVGPVAHQAALDGELSPGIARRQRMTDRQREQLVVPL